MFNACNQIDIVFQNPTSGSSVRKYRTTSCNLLISFALRTFTTLPGITIGDIGKKMGRDGIDNGYIQFTYVRVPRAYMLQKHTQVTREGKVYEPALAQLTYGALLQGRTAMVADAGNVSKKALTIALRYGVVRRQFKTGHNAVSWSYTF